MIYVYYVKIMIILKNMLLNDLDTTNKNKKLLDSIFYWYYSKDLSSKKSDKKGLRLINQFVFKIY